MIKTAKKRLADLAEAKKNFLELLKTLKSFKLELDSKHARMLYAGLSNFELMGISKLTKQLARRKVVAEILKTYIDSAVYHHPELQQLAFDCQEERLLILATTSEEAHELEEALFGLQNKLNEAYGEYNFKVQSTIIKVNNQPLAIAPNYNLIKQTRA
ncbi:MAG: hypothetical protein GY810_21430 [Aureispira sp.]|nr:hypothetical protein [Aureispira sp.]